MISGISSGGLSVQFKRNSVVASISGKCSHCGKKASRSKTFELHMSPFNRNDDGSQMTEDDIKRNLDEKVVNWKEGTEIYHNGCRRSFVIERLRTEGFICAERSDHIDLWVSPDQCLVIDYDLMRIEYRRLLVPNTLEDLVLSIHEYNAKWNSNRSIINAHVQLNDDAKASGKTIVYSYHSFSMPISSARITLNGIGYDKEDAFRNSLLSVIAFAEKAKEYLEKLHE